MKRFFYSVAVLLTTGFLFASCEKEPQKQEEIEKAVVSISADENFSQDNKANLKLTLSKALTTDVKVTLAKAAVQSGKIEIPADYSKNVVISAGKTEASVEVEADVLGIESGEYQAAIKIASVDGAEIAENAVAYINLTYVFKPEVNLVADAAFASNKKANLTVSITKATTADVKVKLVPATDNKYPVTVEPSEVTIPAGETEASAVAEITIPENVEIGTYVHKVSIESAENAVLGKRTVAEINLTYPFSVNITIDGAYDDWNDPNVVTYTLPEGNTLYPMVKTMKLCANEKYVYMYYEFVDPSSIKAFHLGELITPTSLADGNGLPLDIYIDADGDPKTGAIVAAVDNDTAYPPYSADQMGLEWYIELGFHAGEYAFNDFYSWGGAYQYIGADGEGVFSGLKNRGGEYDGSVIFGQTKFEDGLGRTEIQFQRNFFNMKTNKARFALKIMNSSTNWSCLGLMPQGTATDMKDATSRAQVDMATVILPNYVE